jgi:adenylate kinase family enzyme
MLEGQNQLKLVELIGPAGAGKSSVIKKLIESNGSFHLGDDLHLKSIDHIPIFISNIPFLLDRFLTQGASHSRQFSWDELKSIVYLKSAREIFARQQANHDAIFLLDHGPVFKLATLYEFGPDKVKDKEFDQWWQMMFTQWAGSLDFVVSLDAPDDLLHNRINARSQKHAVKNRSPEKASKFLNRYRESFEHIMVNLTKFNGPNYFQLDTGDLSCDQVVQKILTRVLDRNSDRDLNRKLN